MIINLINNQLKMKKQFKSVLWLLFILSETFAHRTLKQSVKFIPSMWISTCIKKCPEKPLDLCDFYFQGYQDMIPQFDIPENSSSSSVKISPSILDKYINKTVNIYNTTRPGCLLNTKKQYKFTRYYYPSSINNIGYIFINASNIANCEDTCGKCVLMYTVVARPHWANGNTTLLLSGDGNLVFPEERRCVIFKTNNCY